MFAVYVHFIVFPAFYQGLWMSAARELEAFCVVGG